MGRLGGQGHLASLPARLLQGTFNCSISWTAQGAEACREQLPSVAMASSGFDWFLCDSDFYTSMPTPDLTPTGHKNYVTFTRWHFPSAYPGLTVHRLPFANTTMLSGLSSNQWLRRNGQRQGVCLKDMGLGETKGLCLPFIRTLRRSRNFETKGGFLDPNWSCRYHFGSS